MDLSPVFLLHRLSAVRFIARGIPLYWYFRCAELSAILAVVLLPHERKVIRFLRRAVGQNEKRLQINRIGRKHVAYRKWLKYLIYGWLNWMDRWEQWSTLEGEEHLTCVLAKGKGAILLSPHRFGFETLLPAVVALRGYPVNRTGRGTSGPGRIAKWGHKDRLPWTYINYGNDYWSHVRALRQIRQALGRNEVLHLSIRTQRSGPPGLEIRLFGQEFFLDPAIVEVIEILQAPVLPCFCIPNEKGVLEVKIYPEMKAARQDIMAAFAPLYTRHLHAHPELSQIWKRLALGWEAW